MLRLSIAIVVIAALIIAYIEKGSENGKSMTPRTIKIRIASRRGAGHKAYFCNLLHSSPRTTRYDGVNADRRRISCANAYPVSKRLEAIARRAPIIPNPTDTDQRPGLPKPMALKPDENQFSALANLVAVTALMPVTPNINKNKSNSSSNGVISIPNNTQSLLMACIPIQR